MAGSWNHMTTKSGQFCGTRHLENLGDCYEALEECFGMVWWLAEQLAFKNAVADGRTTVSREEILGLIKQASANHEDGLEDGGLARKRIFGD